MMVLGLGMLGEGPRVRRVVIRVRLRLGLDTYIIIYFQSTKPDY